MSKTGDPAAKGTITLKLNNISTFMTQIRQRIESPPHQVAGIGWHLEVFPYVVENVTYLSCFLYGTNESKWTAWVDATFRIVNDNGGGFGEETGFHKVLMGHEPLASKGYKDFITSEELLCASNGFVVDDSVELRVDFDVTDVCGASYNVFETAGTLAADIKLKVGDSVFYANKGYLSVVSLVFRDLFALTETGEDSKESEEIELKDIDPSEFKEFLGVIYPTRYPITDANVISLFRIADRYDVKRVVADCEYHLFGAKNVPWFDKLKLAVDLDRENLRDRLIAQMTCDDIKAIDQNKNKYQL